MAKKNRIKIDGRNVCNICSSQNLQNKKKRVVIKLNIQFKFNLRKYYLNLVARVMRNTIF